MSFTILLFLILGLSAGALSGLVGIGGGIIITPALMLLFGFSQLQAQGTTLALLVPPIGAAAAYIYYRQGFVDVKVALLVCLGFIIGSILGAKFAGIFPPTTIKRILGIILFVVAMKFFFEK